MLDRENEYIKMSEVEEQLWWYRILHKMVTDTVKNYFKSKDIEILDAGCGTGGMLKDLIKNGYSNIQGFDLSDFAVNLALEKKLNVRKVDLKSISNNYNANSFDLIISLDNLYFLGEQEQLEFFKSTYKILKTNGLFIVNVPINKSFSGIHDHAVGIEKRLNAKEFIYKIENSGFKRKNIRHWPMLLSPIIYIIRTFQRKSYKFNNKIKSDIDIPSPFLNNLFYILCAFEIKYLYKSIWSSSLFAVFEKTNQF